MTNYFNPVFTDAGRAASADDTGRGLQTVIKYVAMGDGSYAVRDADGVALEASLSATTLQNELLRVQAEAGGSPSPGVLNLVAEIKKAEEADPQFFISEVGFFDSNGILIALWSSDTANLGYRGDIMTWYLSLGLAWFDLPGDAFTVEVLNAPLSQQMLSQARIRSQVEKVVIDSGIAYEESDAELLSQAVDLRISEVSKRLDKTVRTPISVSPADGELNVSLEPTLVSSKYFSADGYEHIASRYFIYDAEGDLFFDSGEVGPLTEYTVAADILPPQESFSWAVSYKGRLGAIEFWSDQSELCLFETTEITSYNSAPVSSAPADGAVNVARQPYLSISSYSVTPSDYDTVDAVQYRVFDDPDKTNLVWDSGVLTTNFTQMRVGIELDLDKTYYWDARQRGSVLGWTDFSLVASFTTTPAAQGAVMDDGGIVVAQRSGYWLVCAPASMRASAMKYGIDAIDTTLTNLSSESVIDPSTGYTNTEVLINNYSDTVGNDGVVGPTAALFCRSQGDDYFLATKEEMSLIAGYGSMIDENDVSSGITFADMGTGSIWSSSESNGLYNYFVRASDGYQNPARRTSQFYVVPVRRIAV